MAILLWLNVAHLSNIYKHPNASNLTRDVERQPDLLAPRRLELRNIGVRAVINLQPANEAEC